MRASISAVIGAISLCFYCLVVSNLMNNTLARTHEREPGERRGGRCGTHSNPLRFRASGRFEVQEGKVQFQSELQRLHRSF